MPLDVSPVKIKYSDSDSDIISLRVCQIFDQYLSCPPVESMDTILQNKSYQTVCTRMLICFQQAKVI